MYAKIYIIPEKLKICVGVFVVYLPITQLVVTTVETFLLSTFERTQLFNLIKLNINIFSQMG